MQFDWKPEYDDLARQFLVQHFGGAQGLTACFPCMRKEYPWAAHRPDVLDSRVPAKNNTEYHGLERHACQYHATAQYEFAYHHWLLAASWRREDMKANRFTDEAHLNAIRYAIKQSLYNKALHFWQQSPSERSPQPKDFGLSVSDLEQKESKAWSELENYASKNS